MTHGELAGYTTIPEPDLVFAGKKIHKHPLLGLLRNGPYSLSLGAPSRIRFALLAPKAHMSKLTSLVGEAQQNGVAARGEELLSRLPRLRETLPNSDRRAGREARHRAA